MAEVRPGRRPAPFHKKSEAFRSSVYIDGLIIVAFYNGSVWAYPAEAWEWALWQRDAASSGHYLNTVLKKRGGTQVREATAPGRRIT